VTTPPNKGMKLTKLSAAWFRGWTCRLMPAPAGMDAGTASQLIPGVRRTWHRHGTWAGLAGLLRSNARQCTGVGQEQSVANGGRGRAFMGRRLRAAGC
jgi:hypothetical protein